MRKAYNIIVANVVGNPIHIFPAKKHNIRKLIQGNDHTKNLDFFLKCDDVIKHKFLTFSYYIALI